MLPLYRMVSAALVVLVLAAGSAVWGYRLGIRVERAKWQRQQDEATIAALTAEILRDSRAYDIAKQHHRAAEIETQAIELRTAQSLEIVKQAIQSDLAGPDAVFPDRVQHEIDAAIERANAAIGRVRNRAAQSAAAKPANAG